MSKEWIGVDLDGTLAFYDGFKGSNHIGEPIPKMIERVKQWRTSGLNVKIFTARADDPKSIPYIEKWCLEYLGEILPITNVKDFDMIELWDDRCIQVIKNTGEVVR